MKLKRFEQLKTKVKRWLLRWLINDMYEQASVVGVFNRSVRPYCGVLEIRDLPKGLGFTLPPVHTEFIGWMLRVFLSTYSSMGSLPEHVANVFFDSDNLHQRRYSFGVDFIGWKEDKIHAEGILETARREVIALVEYTTSVEILDGSTRLRVEVSW